MQRTFFDEEFKEDMLAKKCLTLSEAEDEISDTYTTKTLELLKAGPRTTGELVDAVSHRFSCCINTLRKQGHVIDAEKTESGTWLYTYRRFEKRETVKPEWKEAYYRSGHWLMKRNARKAIDGFRCVRCHDTENLEVHHWVYDLFDEELADLMTFCRECHVQIHENEAIRIHFPHTVDSCIAEKLSALCAD